jgi:hypothetical protein
MRLEGSSFIQITINHGDDFKKRKEESTDESLSLSFFQIRS